MGDRIADVIQFPVAPRLCFDCENALLAPGGIFCGVYQQEIHNEREAEKCDEYSPPRTGPVFIIKGGAEAP